MAGTAVTEYAKTCHRIEQVKGDEAHKGDHEDPSGHFVDSSPVFVNPSAHGGGSIAP